MGPFFGLRLASRVAQEDSAVRPPSAESSDAPIVRDATGLLLTALRASYGNKVGKSDALRVPAFARAYKLYTGTIACFPLRAYTPDGSRAPRSFLDNPSSITTYTSLMARTVGDLVCHDVAYWRVSEWTWDGFPKNAEHMPFDQVSLSPTNPAEAVSEYELGQVFYNGVPVRAKDVIRFDGDGTGGWLATGVDAITTAAELEAAVLRSAEVPAPSVVLKNTGADLSPDEVDALLTAWETARSERTSAYLNSTIDIQGVSGWSPTDLQLVEARNAAATAIGRLTNLDPVWVGAGVPGSSLTYTNRQDLFIQLTSLSLQPVMRQITDRLSMDDITPRGWSVSFDTDTFLRASTPEMADIIQKLVPLEVLTADEAKALIDLPTEGATP